MSTADRVARLQATGLTPDQALAIMSEVEDRAVTRDYLDSRIESLFNRLLIASLAIAGFSIAVITALGRLLA